MCRTLPEGEFSRSLIIQAATKLAQLEHEGQAYEETLERLADSYKELKAVQAKVAELSAEEARYWKTSRVAAFLVDLVMIS